MATVTPLTPTQKKLVAELDKITSAAGLDYWHIHDPGWADDEFRTVGLQVILRAIVRGEVVSRYTLLDEQLGSAICRYMFDNKPFVKLWKTKKFERFNYFVIEKMSLLEKLAFVKDVYTIPRSIAANIEGINAIRNALAHAFFPENLRAYRTKQGSTFRRLAGPYYRGIDIFTFDGYDRFLDDAHSVTTFLIESVRRKKSQRGATVSLTGRGSE